MLDRINTQLLSENSFLILKQFKCRACGQLIEFLTNLSADLKDTARCHTCGGNDLEAAPGINRQDYYW